MKKKEKPAKLVLTATPLTATFILNDEEFQDMCLRYVNIHKRAGMPNQNPDITACIQDIEHAPSRIMLIQSQYMGSTTADQTGSPYPQRCTSLTEFMIYKDTSPAYFIPYKYNGKNNKIYKTFKGGMQRRGKCRYYDLTIDEYGDCDPYVIYVNSADKIINSINGFDNPYSCYESLRQEFKNKFERYLPEDFDWDDHIGILSREKI